MSDEDSETNVELEEVRHVCETVFIVKGQTFSDQISLDVANERKQQGNDLFRVGKWEGAMSAYRSALGCLPKRTVGAPGPMPADSDTLSDSGDESQGRESGSGSKSKAKGGDRTTDEKEEEVVEVVTPVVEQSEREMKTLRAVLNANIAACYLKLVRSPSIRSQEIHLNLSREVTKTRLNRALKVWLQQFVAFQFNSPVDSITR
jgi:hypothetical protein